MSGISTHVLDTGRGRPAAGIHVRLTLDGREVAHGVTDADGRCKPLLAAEKVHAGTYRLWFGGEYFAAGFYPEITIAFRVNEDGGSYHVPVLLSAFGYTTYRGS